MRIIDLKPTDHNLIQQIAHLLIEAFQEHHPHFLPTLEAALQEVNQSFEEGCASRVALNEKEEVLGWIGAIADYDGNVWELHPLVVNTLYQNQGIGRALVQDLEDQARQHGALTLMLGADDETKQTTLGGIDLYPNVQEHIINIKNLAHHPYEFYQKVGFVIVGVVPDANGIGKPDIIMAKRL